MGLSLRLAKIASMVERVSALADIGTDHALLPIYLIEKEICNRAYACDIKKGPLMVALKNIKAKGLLDKIMVLEGSGLLVLEGRECQAAIIAGMGGHLIRDILKEGLEIAKRLDYLVLQPNTEEDKLRAFLYDNTFEVHEEAIVKDGKHFYLILKVSYTGIKRDYNRIDLKVGNLKKYEMEEDLLEYFKILRTKAEKQIRGISKSKDIDTEKIEENKELIRWLDENVKGI